MAIIFFDPPEIRKNLLPFTYTRPVSEIRTGIFKISEKWKRHFPGPWGWLTEEYLQPLFPLASGSDHENIFINGAVCPTPALVKEINHLSPDVALMKGEMILAVKSSQKFSSAEKLPEKVKSKKEYTNELTLVDHLWKIFRQNRQELINDFQWLQSEASEDIKDPHTIVYGKENLFIEKGVSIKAAILNAENGPIYLGRDSQIGEGSVIRGPFALGEGSILKMGTRVIGDTTVGPYSKVGGEISNTVIFGYSNKSHEGFLGNSVIGEWCNIGADTNTSNLKNNYKKVKLWSYRSEMMEQTDLQFCGLMMADHAKCGINTMFNTATTVGVGANVFGAGFPPNFIPSFSWGGSGGFETFRFDKFIEMTEVVFERRSVKLSPEDIAMLKVVYDESARFRTWEK